LRHGRNAGGETAREPGEHQLDGGCATVLGREDFRMIRLEREFGAVLLLLTEPVKVVDVRAAMCALLPLAGRAPSEFRRLRRFAQSFTRLEKGAYVDTVVDRRCHG
jgi:hypothetical protein